jgi:hypothetical protein
MSQSGESQGRVSHLQRLHSCEIQDETVRTFSRCGSVSETVGQSGESVACLAVCVSIPATHSRLSRPGCSLSAAGVIILIAER